MSDEEKPKPPSLLKKELDELKSKQVENRKRFMQTSIVDGPEVDSFDGVGTESQNDEIIIQPGPFKAIPFKNQSCNTDQNQTENKSKKVEIRKRVVKSTVDGPQVESFDGAGTKSQIDDISVQPESFKADPLKNQSINAKPPDAKQTENHFKQVQIKSHLLFKNTHLRTLLKELW